MAATLKKFSAVIIVLAVLLGLCVSTFAVTAQTALAQTVITSDRAKQTVISIYKTQAEDSAPFHLDNMFPGDRELESFLVKVSHVGTVTLHFHADIRPGYEKLAEVLMCRVALRGENEPLYDGLMRDMPQSLDRRLIAASASTSELTYDITVYLDTSVGNEYMNKELYADFRWWVEASGSDAYPQYPDATPAPDRDDGSLIYPPQMGDHTNLALWIGIMAVSLVMLILLLWTKRRRHNDKEGE